MESWNGALNDIENASIPLEVSVKKELESLLPISSVCSSISRVPQRLRLANEKVYTPQVVSIGPLHHGKESLKAMEEHKKRFLQNFLRRTNVSLDHHINIIRESETRLRRSYAEPIRFGSDEFVKIVIVDAAFVAEVLLRNWFDEFQDDHSHGFYNKTWMLQDVFPDLWLLENQLPFFIIEDLLITVPCGDTEKLLITKLCHKLLKEVVNFDREWDNLEKICFFKVLHFVDFLRKLCVPLSMGLHGGGKLKTLTIPSISELVQCGVRIKERSSSSLCDIHFSDGILEIPKMGITLITELATRNVLAFEQLHCRETYVNDYVMVINHLVSTPKDVDLLVKHGIVENKLGNSIEVSSFTNKLADGLIVKSNEFYFASICDELNTYCRTPWNTWKANLKQNYFGSPWAIVSVIAAFLLIVLTIIQAVCSVLSVSRGNVY